MRLGIEEWASVRTGTGEFADVNPPLFVTSAFRPIRVTIPFCERGGSRKWRFSTDGFCYNRSDSERDFTDGPTTREAARHLGLEFPTSGLP